MLPIDVNFEACLRKTGRGCGQDVVEIKYVTGSISTQNLWAKDIVYSISRALCSFAHSHLICCICTTWSMITRVENTKNLGVVVP